MIKYMLYTVGFIAHSIGIHALKSYLGVSKQALILLKLSVIELAAICFAISHDMSHKKIGCNRKSFDNKKDVKDVLITEHSTEYEELNNFLFRIIVNDLMLTMFIVNLDRLFFACNPTKYGNMNVFTVKIITVGSLLLSIITAGIFSYIPEIDFVFDYISIVALFSFIAFSLVTYIFISSKLMKSLGLIRGRYVLLDIRYRIQFSRDYLVAFLITLSCIVFYCIPGPLLLLYAEQLNSIDLEGIETGYIIGFICHPFFYIFLTTNFRNKVLRKFINGNRNDDVSGGCEEIYIDVVPLK